MAFASIDRNLDRGLEGDILVSLVRDGQIAQLIQSVGGIGDELAEEYLFVRVQRMGDELKQS